MLKNHIIPNDIIDRVRTAPVGIITEYHGSNDICALFKFRDLILIKKTEPDVGKKKKVVSWRKKTNDEINEILANQVWR